jgi:hypothetical protein
LVVCKVTASSSVFQLAHRKRRRRRKEKSKTVGKYG